MRERKMNEVRSGNESRKPKSPSLPPIHFPFPHLPFPQIPHYIRMQCPDRKYGYDSLFPGSPTPFAAAIMPNHDAELIDTVRLSLVDGVGPRIRRRLLDRFGDPAAVLAAAPSELREVEGVGPKLTERIIRAGDEIDAEGEIALCRQPRHRDPHRDPRRVSPCPPRDPRSARLALRPRHAQAVRRPGHRHRRHPARHGLRAAAGRTAGGQPRAGPD